MYFIDQIFILNQDLCLATFKVPTLLFHQQSRPLLDVPHSLLHHNLRDFIEHPDNLSLQISERSRHGFVHLLLQVTPKPDITGIHIWGRWCTVHSSPRVQGQHPLPKYGIQPIEYHFVFAPSCCQTTCLNLA